MGIPIDPKAPKKHEEIIVDSGIIMPKIEDAKIEKKASIDYIELNNFMNEKNIQIYLSEKKEENKDKAFQNLKEFEFKELQKIFNEKYNNYITDFQKEKINIKLEQNLIDTILKNENSSNVYKQKIKDQILSIKSNDQSYQIKYLKILLVGRKGVGKTTLINYILNLKENKINHNSKDNFVIYENEEVPYLKLVKFRGIGLDKFSNPETIGNEALNYIRTEINKKKKWKL